MTAEEQTQALADDLDALVRRYALEFDLTYAAVVGVLQIKIHLLCESAGNQYQDDEEEEED